MDIKVNGEPRRIEPGMTIVQLLGELGLEPRHLAIEHNGDIVDETSIAGIDLKAGDTLEIIRFVGGG